jgi:hypothetical protein
LPQLGRAAALKSATTFYQVDRVGRLCDCFAAERDINTVTNVARLMIQDITDVFGVIEQRGLEPK